MAIFCRICEGAGQRVITNKSGDRYVQDCTCRVQSRQLRILERAKVPLRYAHCNLEDYDTGFPSATPSLRGACGWATDFVNRYPQQTSHRGALLTGSIGVGKTHLAVGILKKAILERGATGLFVDYRDLLKQIQNTYSQRGGATEMDVLEPVFRAEILVLDELGASKPTEWVWDTIAHILNTRYNECRTTIITTNYANLPPAGYTDTSNGGSLSMVRSAGREETLGDRIGERMRSRLQEMCVVREMHGRDFRQLVMRADYAEA